MENEQVTRFTSLWTQTQTSVFAFVSSTITNFSDAEDVLQRVASVAVRKFDDFDRQGDASSFTGWAISIARYEILSFLRERSTDKHEFLADSLGQIEAAFEEISPECDDRRKALSNCIDKLQGRPREVLEKRYGEQLKTGSIAQRLGLTPGNVSVILNRTYRALRACVEKQLVTEVPGS